MYPAKLYPALDPAGCWFLTSYLNAGSGVFQSDKATVKEAIQAFLEIRQNWSLSTLPVETRSELDTICIKRWKMFSEGLMGSLT